MREHVSLIDRVKHHLTRSARIKDAIDAEIYVSAAVAAETYRLWMAAVREIGAARELTVD